MVEVPAGWFTKGCSRYLARLVPPSERAPDGVSSIARNLAESCVNEAPPRRVWISSFQIDRLEATQEDLKACVVAGKCSDDVANLYYGYEGGRSSLLNKDQARLPGGVTYQTAQHYCAWRGKRLPTAAEWEKTARGTDDRIFPWGDSPPTCDRTTKMRARYEGSVVGCRTTEAAIRPVDTLPGGASFYGAQDMDDNAREWVSDWYAKPVVDGTTKPHFTIAHRGDDLFLDLDWSSVRAAFPDSVVDPRGPVESGVKPPARAIIGIGEMITGSSPGSVVEAYAGIRCVRPMPGPEAPAIAGPTPGELAPLFREPGYQPRRSMEGAL